MRYAGAFAVLIALLTGTAACDGAASSSREPADTATANLAERQALADMLAAKASNAAGDVQLACEQVLFAFRSGGLGDGGVLADFATQLDGFVDRAGPATTTTLRQMQRETSAMAAELARTPGPNRTDAFVRAYGELTRNCIRVESGTLKR